MKPEIKRRWIEALRSGKYRQGFEYLRTPPSFQSEDSPTFCCLGVLAEIAVEDGVVTREDGCGPSTYDFSATHLVDKIRDWAGFWPYYDNVFDPDEIALHCPSCRPLRRGLDLVELNDDCCVPFSEIADLVEACL